MKPISFHFLFVSMILVTLAILCPQSISAAGATSTEINNTIVLNGSIPLTWENDASYPWIVDNGRMKSGNAGIKNSSSSLKFKYSSTCVTNISFIYQNNDYNASTHTVEVLVDGVVKYNSNNNEYELTVQFRLPIGNHSVEIRNAIGNSSSSAYYALLRNVSVTETQPASTASLNNLVLDGSTNITWTNDTKYPWTIENGYAKSGNFGLKDTKS